MISVLWLVDSALEIYSWTIVIYILLSWFPNGEMVHQVRMFLEPVVEPYVGLFRRIVPTTGAIDFSPLIAILVLQYVIRGIILRQLIYLFA